MISGKNVYVKCTLKLHVNFSLEKDSRESKSIEWNGNKVHNEDADSCFYVLIKLDTFPEQFMCCQVMHCCTFHSLE